MLDVIIQRKEFTMKINLTKEELTYISKALNVMNSKLVLDSECENEEEIEWKLDLASRIIDAWFECE